MTFQKAHNSIKCDAAVATAQTPFDSAADQGSGQTHLLTKFILNDLNVSIDYIGFRQNEAGLWLLRQSRTELKMETHSGAA